MTADELRAKLAEWLRAGLAMLEPAPIPDPEPDDVLVPFVVGMSLSEAISAIEAVGLSPIFNGDSTQLVASQEPPAGRLVPRGSQVTLTMAVAPEPLLVPVPNIVGMVTEQAYLALYAAGLTGRDEDGSPSLWIVEQQMPMAGTLVPFGTEVAIWLKAPPPPPDPDPDPTLVTVPNMIGFRHAAVEATLVASNLRGAVQGPWRTGIVEKTLPAPGALVAPGTFITVFYIAVDSHQATVPNVVGLSYGTAKAVIEGQGLFASPIGDTNGTVESQSPAAGTVVDIESIVTLTLKAAVPGPDPVPEPVLGFIVTPFDRIPDFGMTPTISNVQEGAWNDPDTWDAHRIPVQGDVISITSDGSVMKEEEL